MLLIQYPSEFDPRWYTCIIPMKCSSLWGVIDRISLFAHTIPLWDTRKHYRRGSWDSTHPTPNWSNTLKKKIPLRIFFLCKGFLATSQHRYTPIQPYIFSNILRPDVNKITPENELFPLFPAKFLQKALLEVLLALFYHWLENYEAFFSSTVLF